jgi:asparagine synthase (glutamine-hydrolysing)
VCRIFGVFNAVPDDRELQAVAALLVHGGPDAQSTAAGPDWALGSNRLAIIDVEHGEQPYRLGAVTVVFNGELYNHGELRAGLVQRGFTFPDRCDGSILPALYTVFGDSFAEHLDGMFSVAVLDLRAEPRLVIATDDAGMKPLYYHWEPADARLRFASELPALLAFAGVPAVEAPLGLDAYLTSKTPFGEQTMFDGIRVLPPGSTAVVTRSGGLRIRSRIGLGSVPVSAAATAAGPSYERATGRADDLAEVGAQLRELLAVEVQRLLVADVPVAVVTSGGLDSSLVTALAAKAAGELHSFNIAYTGTWPADERGYAREVAEACGTVHHQVEIDPDTFPDLLTDVIEHLGQPNADPITLSTFALFRAVRDAGFKVALTGDAADELFGGYARMAQAVASGPADDWAADYLDSFAAVPRELRDDLYTEDYAEAVRGQGSPIPAPALRALADGPGSRLARISMVEQQYRLPAYHLRRVDHLSMASSVEARLPFCQPEVLRFAAQLRDEHKISPAGVKRALYAAAAGLVPDSVLNRPKQPFTLPVTAMLAPGSALWELAADTLSDSALRADGRLRPEAVRRLFDRQAARPSDADSLAIWSLMTHRLWRERFLGPAARTSAERSLAGSGVGSGVLV